MDPEGVTNGSREIREIEIPEIPATFI